MERAKAGKARLTKAGMQIFPGERLIFLAVSRPNCRREWRISPRRPDGLDGFDSASSEDAVSQQADGGPDGTAAPQQEETGNPDSRTPWEGSPNFGGGTGGFGSGSAAALHYIDDDLDSYSVIWDSQVFSSTKATTSAWCRH